MATLTIPNLRHGYLDIVEYVAKNGVRVSPRGEPTTEVLDAVIILEDPADALPVGIGRKLNLRIAAAEALQLIGGFSDPGLMTRTSENFHRFLESDGNFWGAYGKRIARQVEACERKLMEDPDTRQAVITLWDPLRDNQRGRRDYPCTVMLQFLIRGGKLIMHTTMRSNDVFWGLTYDVFQFTQLQLTLAGCLGVVPGPYHHHAVSLHIYQRDWAALEQLHDPNHTLSLYPLGIGRSLFDPFKAAKARAQIIGAKDVVLSDPTPSEAWYRGQLEDIL